ncbi:hypothetical protein LshimejAT787_1202760 [Lyophyllum shimeji]|uniref:Uncharacterized protein n=1 Tax=Lyophyllum shimeji TaxID=47721 RepID=A0A9P3PX14_LYOSH|nr:hypothetical protein LshimejAT787_1202760 [Lyophyllum shimeji]
MHHNVCVLPGAFVLLRIRLFEFRRIPPQWWIRWMSGDRREVHERSGFGRLLTIPSLHRLRSARAESTIEVRILKLRRKWPALVRKRSHKPSRIYTRAAHRTVQTRLYGTVIRLPCLAVQDPAFPFVRLLYGSLTRCFFSLKRNRTNGSPSPSTSQYGIRLWPYDGRRAALI